MSPTDRLAWLEQRRTGIGSSDSANLIGLGYRNALAVYRSKVEPVRASEPTGVLAAGLACEPLCLRMYADAMGVSLLPGGMVRHPNRTWQFVTRDAVRADDAGVEVEAKTVAGFGADWGEPGTADIPDGYQVQAQKIMSVAGSLMCDVPVLCRISWDFRVYRVPFSPPFFDWLTDIEHRFLRDHVKTLTPPGPAWEEQFAGEARRLLLPVPGKRVELGPEAVTLARQRAAVAAVKKDAEAEYDRLTGELVNMLGDAERGDGPGLKVKRAFVKGGSYTAERKDYWRTTVTLDKE